jgi:hypothetical protein
MAEDDKTGKIRKNIAPEELKIAFSGPALFTNKFYLTITGPIARIAFTETHPNLSPTYRTAVSMTLDDLLRLRDVIDNLASDFQQVAITVEEKDG